MKITVRSPVQHDGATYSPGRHDVEDENVAQELISSGAASEGWTEKEGALSEAGTRTPPERPAPTGTTAGAPRRTAAAENPDKTSTGSSKSQS
jgi:hypothetical protein